MLIVFTILFYLASFLVVVLKLIGYVICIPQILFAIIFRKIGFNKQNSNIIIMNFFFIFALVYFFLFFNIHIMLLFYYLFEITSKFQLFISFILVNTFMMLMYSIINLKEFSFVEESMDIFRVLPMGLCFFLFLILFGVSLNFNILRILTNYSYYNYLELHLGSIILESSLLFVSNILTLLHFINPLSMTRIPGILKNYYKSSGNFKSAYFILFDFLYIAIIPLNLVMNPITFIINTIKLFRGIFS